MRDEILNGWVVVKMDPWDFHGPFPDRGTAEKIAQGLNARGHEYVVRWGEKPRSKLRKSELALWKGKADETSGSAVRAGQHGRANNRKSTARASGRR